MFIVSKKNIQTWQTSTSTVSTVPSKKKREDNKMQHEFNSSSECKFFVKSYRTIVLIHFKTGNECSRALLPQLMQLVHLRFLTSWITPLIIINSATDQFDFPRFKNRRRYAKLAVEKRRGIPLPSPSRKDNLRFVHTQRNSYATVADIWRWSRSISVSEIVKRTGFFPSYSIFQ